MNLSGFADSLASVLVSADGLWTAADVSVDADVPAGSFFAHPATLASTIITAISNTITFFISFPSFCLFLCTDVQNSDHDLSSVVVIIDTHTITETADFISRCFLTAFSRRKAPVVYRLAP
jgi:hypothetical protein